MMRPTSVRCEDCGLQVPVAARGPIPSRCQSCKHSRANEIRALGAEPELFARMRADLRTP